MSSRHLVVDSQEIYSRQGKRLRGWIPCLRMPSLPVSLASVWSVWLPHVVGVPLKMKVLVGVFLMGILGWGGQNKSAGWLSGSSI